MAQSSTSHVLLRGARCVRGVNVADQSSRCLRPNAHRTFATAIETPTATTINTQFESPTMQTARILTTLRSWPDLEPKRFAWFSSQHLDMPLRKDILHRAVVYEADIHRGMSTASTKYRRDVHGSNRKIAPQKGRGAARVGDKKSPIRRGGGVAFGPHPRDYSSELPRKIYDIAWRTALSHRYRKGELIVLDNQMTIPLNSTPRLLDNIFVQNKWGHDNGRTLLVADRLDRLAIESREEEDLARMQERLFDLMPQVGQHGAIKDLDDVDVKDLLETGRIVIDQQSLDNLLARHSGDLISNITRVR